MTHEFKVESERVTVTMIPDTALDRAVIEGIGTAQTATIRKNGVLTFVIDVPRAPIAKPSTPRPADEVRDTQ